jgi:esterase/lipase superfamily enzyme
VRSFCAALAFVGCALAGCVSNYPLMPAPALYVGPQAKPLFTALPSDLRSPPIDLFYITDRAPASKPDDTEPYTAGRSRSMAFGSTVVDFEGNLSWDEIVRQSTAPVRAAPLDLKLGPTRELGRYPRLPYWVIATPAGITRSPADLAAHATADKALQAELARRLSQSPRKEIVLFVHGFANTFQDSAFTMAELCHFLGREFVCGIFSWPAGASGLLLGYDVDRESSEFAVAHLRTALRTIAGTPGLERIHLIAHSRGTDVVASAASELTVEAYIGESTIGQRFKIGNVVLAAPDIDIDVAPSKIFRVLSDPDLPWGKAPNPTVVFPGPAGLHLTVYASPDDKALATAGWLFGSLSRLGRVRAAMFSVEDIAEARKLPLLDVIEVPGTTDFFGHSYFVSDPLVSSDIIAMLRYGLKPNDPGRPLIEIARPFWRVRMPEEAGLAH